MRRTCDLAAVWLSMFVLTVACGGGNDNGGGAAEITISATQGGTLQSADGRFRLEIPAGAVTAETTVSVAVGTPDDLPVLAGIDDAEHVYRLAPDGLTFAIPAAGTLTLDAVAAVDGAYPLPAIAHVRSDGTDAPLGELSVVADPGVATIATFELSSFSSVVTRSSSFGTIAGPATATGLVGVPFPLEITTVWMVQEGQVPAAQAHGAGPIYPLTQCRHFSEGAIVLGQPYQQDVSYVCVDVGEGRPQISGAAALRNANGFAGCTYLGYLVPVTCQANPEPLDVPGLQEFGDATIVMTLVLGGKLYPRDQFAWALPDECTGNHWHSPNTVFPIGTLVGDFVTIDLDDQAGITDQAPMGCGFGKVADVPQRPVVLPTTDWAKFLANH